MPVGMVRVARPTSRGSPCATEHDGDHVRVAQHPAGGFDGDRDAGVEHPRCAAGRPGCGRLQAFQAHGEGDVGSFAAHLRQVGGGLLAQLDERVGVAGAGVAQVGDAVDGRVRCGKRTEHRQRERAGFFVQLAA